MDTFRVCAVKDRYHPLDHGVFQEPSEGKTAWDTNGPACLHLTEVVPLQDPPGFIARKPWDIVGPFSVRLADL